jgi:flavin reductase (DIM6/NTAB) family NADH-FMN oxidoreductase RutF
MAAMEDLSYKIVKLIGARQERDEIVLQSSDFLICQAAFEKALFVWPKEHLEMRQLAAKAVDRFAGIQWKAGAEGAVFIEGSSAWLDCSIFDSFCAGDHEIILMRVEGFEAKREISPLIFHASRFKQLLLS